jgi:hypothetical protein
MIERGVEIDCSQYWRREDEKTRAFLSRLIPTRIVQQGQVRDSRLDAKPNKPRRFDTLSNVLSDVRFGSTAPLSSDARRVP